MTEVRLDPRVLTEDEIEEARLDAQALADVEAGRVVPHEEVAAWLRSWGTANELPRPRPKAR
jgi:predicted transcriptional regulator